MPRHTPLPEDEARIAAIRDRALLTLRYIEGVEDFPAGPQMREVVEDCARRGDLRSLRLIEREITGMTTALTPTARAGLEAQLREMLGIDADAERAAMRRHVAEIVARGTIASEKERRRLAEYADVLEAAGGDEAEIAAVHRLLRA